MYQKIFPQNCPPPPYPLGLPPGEVWIATRGFIVFFILLMFPWFTFGFFCVLGCSRLTPQPPRLEDLYFQPTTVVQSLLVAVRSGSVANLEEVSLILEFISPRPIAFAAANEICLPGVVRVWCWVRWGLSIPGEWSRGRDKKVYQVDPSQ